MNPTGDPTLDRWPSKVRQTECSEGGGVEQRNSSTRKFRGGRKEMQQVETLLLAAYRDFNYNCGRTGSRTICQIGREQVCRGKIHIYIYTYIHVGVCWKVK